MLESLKVRAMAAGANKKVKKKKKGKEGDGLCVPVCLHWFNQ